MGQSIIHGNKTFNACSAVSAEIRRACDHQSSPLVFVSTHLTSACHAIEEPGNREPRIENERRHNFSFSVLGSPFPGFLRQNLRANNTHASDKDTHLRIGEEITVWGSRTRESSDRSLTTSATTVIDAPVLTRSESFEVAVVAAISGHSDGP